MPSKESLEKAAQAWCDPTTSHLVMETALATVFAEFLDEQRREMRLRAQYGSFCFSCAKSGEDPWSYEQFVSYEMSKNCVS